MAGRNYVLELNQRRPIRTDSSEYGSKKPKLVLDCLDSQVSSRPNVTAFKVKRDGKWIDTTWKQYNDQCRAFAKSLIKLGHEAKRPTSILGFNSPEWFVSALGSVMAGGIITGIYNTNGPEACHYVIDHSDSFLVAVDTKDQLAKILEVRDRLPKVKAIVIWLDDKPADAPGDVYTFKEFLDLGKDVSDSDLKARHDAQDPADCVSLIYTSGTTGPPKAVMLSQDNLTWTAERVAKDRYKLDHTEHIVSYLPLSHIAAQMVDMVLSSTIGCTVWFAQPDALKGSLLGTLQEARPTVFLTVPRVWIKMMEGMKAKAAQGSGLQKKLSAFAKGKGAEWAAANQYGGDKHSPSMMFVANIVFGKVRKALGLDRAKVLASAAAPISREVLEFFASLHVPIWEIYGMSESTGPQTVGFTEGWRIGSTGQSFPGAETRIDKPTNGEGEICFRGRHVFMGYLKNEEATAKTIDDDGWLHSGDVGKVDADGFLFITGRIKELIITEGGENIPPVLIENALKKELPAVSNIMVVGDHRKYLTMLVTLKAEQNRKADNGEYEYFDELTGPAKAELAAAGYSGKSASEAAKSDAVRKYIQAGLDKVNAQATSNAQKVQKFVVLERDFTLSGGELTETQKLKRAVAAKKYSAEIEGMYA